MRRPALALAAMVVLLLGVSRGWAACPVEDPPDVVCSPAIEAKVQDLGSDPVRIYEFVRNEFTYEPYFGLQKGPDGTLRARSGNHYDLAALLVSMLRTAGYEARFAKSRIALTEAQATAWTGAANGLGARRYMAALEPTAWSATRTNPWAGEVAKTTWSPSKGVVERDHVWVEARVPLARYRGNAAGGAAATAWVPLDPSFKLREQRAGIALPFDTDPDLALDTLGPGGLYAKIDPRNPLEIFEEKVQQYLARNHPGATLDDVSPSGAILVQAPGILPAALPYELVDPAQVQRSDRLTDLHAAPEDYHYVVRVAVCLGNLNSTNCRGLGDTKLADPATPQSNLVLVYETSTAHMETQRVSLTFPPQSFSSWNDYADVDCSQIRSRDTIPRLTVDGLDPPVGLIVENPTRTFKLCDTLRMAVWVVAPQRVNPLQIWSGGKVLVGGMAAPALVYQSESADTTAMFGARLADAVTAYPVVEELDSGGQPTGKVFVDDDPTGTPGVKDPSEVYLGRHFEAQEALLGTILRLAAARWGELTRVHRARGSALYHRLPSYYPAVGLVSSRNEYEYLFDEAVGLRAGGLLIDIQGYLAFNWDRDGNAQTASDAQGEADDYAELVGHADSAAEHEVWEQVAAVDAVSTVRGMQIASALGVDILSIRDSADAEAQLDPLCDGTYLVCEPDTGCQTRVWGPGTPISTVTASTISPSDYAQIGGLPPEDGTCSGVDFDTYCEVRKRFGAPKDEVWLAPYWDAYLCNVRHPFVTEELRIPARSRFQYRDWDGSIYYARRSNLFEYKIAPDGQQLGGGRALDASLRNGFGTQQTFANAVLYFSDAYLVASQLQGVGVTWDDEWSSVAQQVVNHPDLYELNFAPALLATVSDPVSIVSGDLYHLETDIEIPGPGGQALRLVRSYNSRLAYDGPFGYGWTHTYDQHLRIEQPASGRRVVRVREDGGEVVFREDASGALRPDAWVHDTLVENPSDGSFTLTTKEGMIYRYAAPDAAQRARISEIEDRNGNRVDVQRLANGELDRVCVGTGSSQRCLDFDTVTASNPAQTVTTVSDWTQRQWRYVVDANGDLVEFWDPVQVAAEAATPQSGRPVRYTYLGGRSNSALDHNMETWEVPSDQSSSAVWSMTYDYYADDRVRSHKDSADRTTSFVYGLNQNRTWATYPDGSGESWVFNAIGRIIRHESASGAVRIWEYDPRSGDQLVAVDGLGQATYAQYDRQGNMIERVDRLGATESWTYGPFGLPLSHVDRRGHERRWEYDGRGNLLREWATLDGRLELLRELTYDGLGNVVAETAHQEPGGGAPALTRFAYDATGSVVVRTTDALGNETRFVPDVLGRIVRTERQVALGLGPPQPVAVEMQYDALDRVEVARAADGVETQTLYRPDGLVEQVQTVAPSPSGPIARTEQALDYDAANQLVERSDALGQKTLFAYDARGRRVRTTSPLGNVVAETWDGDGRRTRMFDPSGAPWQWHYDANGRPLEAVDPLGQTERTVYDAEGRPVEAYGIGGRLVTRNTFDAEGNLVLTVDGDGYAFEQTVDELGRVRERTGPYREDPSTGALQALPETGTTRFEYDLAGRMLARTDANGHTVRVAYDALGRTIAVTDALGRTTTTDYDARGLAVATTNGAGETVRMLRDAMGRIVERRIDGRPGETARFQYDPLGRLVYHEQESIARRLRYDDLDRPIALTDVALGTARRVYDAEGRVVQAVYPDGGASGYGYPTGLVVTYAYDARGNVASLTDPRVGTWRFGYDAAGRLLRRTDPYGFERQLSYDSEGFVAQVYVRAPGAPVFTSACDVGTLVAAEQGTYLGDCLSYAGYDARGNPGVVTSREGTTQLQVDALSRLTRVDYPDASFETFQYDGVGNRSRHTDRAGTDTFWKYDVADQLVKIHLQGQAASPLRSFTYDAAGRRATETDAGGITTTYGYDGLGRLRSVTPTSGHAVIGITYAADGSRYTQLESGGVVSVWFGEWLQGSGAVVNGLVHAPGIDNVIAEVTTGVSGSPVQSVRTLFRDGRANVSHVAAGGAFEPTPLRYEAFGTLRAGSTAAIHGFAGRPIEASGLVYLRARHYDPTTGRFLQPDPLGLQADHLYAYAANNPFVFWDPSGLVIASIDRQVPGGLWNLARGVGGVVVMGTAMSACGATLSVPCLIAAGIGWTYGSDQLATAVFNADGGDRRALGSELISATTGLDPGIADLGYDLVGTGAELAAARAMLAPAARSAEQAIATRGAPEAGQKVFRVWGDDAGAWGRSWTRTDPRSVPGYRDAAGLPGQNTGRFVSEGRLTNTEGVLSRRALPLEGKPGGLDELVVPDPRRQIELERVLGVNPEF